MECLFRHFQALGLQPENLYLAQQFLYGGSGVHDSAIPLGGPVVIGCNREKYLTVHHIHGIFATFLNIRNGGKHSFVISSGSEKSRTFMQEISPVGRNDTVSIHSFCKRRLSLRILVDIFINFLYK
jgi:hypothetical protein